MLAEDMLDLKTYLQKNGILFCYCGYMTEDILMGIGSAMKKKLELDEIDKKTTRSVFSVFVEQVQNVIRYSAEKEPPVGMAELRYGVLTVGQLESRVFITCGNMVTIEDAARLKTSLDKIKSLDQKALKALWKETLKGETPEGSKGAGIGFIDIARRAKGGIEFDFKEMDGQMSFFALKAYI